MPSYPSIHLNPRHVAYTMPLPDMWIRHSETISLPDRVMPSSRWPELMSISTLAEYLDMSTNSVRNLIVNGVLPDATTAPTPRMKRWKRSAIDETLQRLADRKCSAGTSMTDALHMNRGQ